MPLFDETRRIRPAPRTTVSGGHHTLKVVVGLIFLGMVMVLARSSMNIRSVSETPGFQDDLQLRTESVDPIEEALARASMEQPQQADAHGGTDTNPSSFKSSRTNVGQLKVPGHQLADDSDEHKGMQNADIPIKVVEADTSTSLSGTHSGGGDAADGAHHDGAPFEDLGLAVDGDLNAGGIAADALGATQMSAAQSIESCKVNLMSMSHKDKLAFFENHPQCQYLNQCEAMLEPTNTSSQVKVLQNSFLFRYSEEIRYSHMAMIAQLPSKLFVAAWQAAPSAGNETRMRLGVEGLDQQHLLISHSRDEAGVMWSSPQKVPLRNQGSLWSPVLHVDRRGVLWLFYSESVGCRKAVPCKNCPYPPCELKDTSALCHMDPKLWVPGGDIKVVTSVGDPVRNAWSPARTLLAQSEHGGIPKVISNSVTVLATGEWLLPYWREQAKSAIPDDGCVRSSETNTSECILKDGGPCMTGAEESAGVLRSDDEGATWKAYGAVTSVYTSLIEGSLVELRNSSLFMVFRSTTGCLFSAISLDKGITWKDPVTMAVPNPNSKVQMMKLEPGGELLLAFNNHRPPGTYRGLRACKACRTRLHIALSEDNGDTWRHVHSLDDEMSSSAVRLHYPGMVQVGTGTKVAVVYSRFYLGRKVGIASLDQGIKFAMIDVADALARNKKLPVFGLWRR